MPDVHAAILSLRDDGASASRRGKLWGAGSFVLLALLLAVVFPLAMDVFRLGLAAKYLSLAFFAVGLVLIRG